MKIVFRLYLDVFFFTIQVTNVMTTTTAPSFEPSAFGTASQPLPYQIKTIAGTGRSVAEGGNNVLEKNEKSNNCWVSTDGFIYFLSVSKVVRKMSIQSGITSIIIGDISNPAGFVDDSPFTSAKFQLPRYIWGDSIGNFYISAGPRVLVAIASTSILSNFAGTVLGPDPTGPNGDGGPATSATFRAPTHLCGDSNGYIYVTDANNFKVRKVGNSASHIISTLAGNGVSAVGDDNIQATSTSLFTTVTTGNFVNTMGSVYIMTNNKLRLVDQITGIIKAVAGTLILDFKLIFVVF
jgi:hypothetical protein